MATETTTVIQEYSATEARISELREKYGGTIYPVETSAGMELAKAARAEIRKWRTGLEKTRVEIKAPALARCQAIDGEAKRITTALLAIESPIDAQIKAEEGKAEAAAKAKMDEIIAKAKAFEELQERQRKEAEQAALQKQRDEIAKQRAEVEAAAAEQRKRDSEANAARIEADRAAAAERAAAQKKLDEERAAHAAAVAKMASEKAATEKREKAEREAQFIASASLMDAAVAALALLEEQFLSEHPTTKALAAAIERCKVEEFKA